MRVLRLLSCAILLAALDAGAASNEAACAYAMKKTKGMVPDLCTMMRKDDNLNALWHSALASRRWRILPGILLAGGAVVLAEVAMYNAIQDVRICLGTVLEPEGNAGCSEKKGPVGPLFALSGIMVVADIFVWAWPNHALENALAATREARLTYDAKADTLQSEPAQSAAEKPAVQPEPASEKVEVPCDEIKNPALRFDCGRRRRNAEQVE